MVKPLLAALTILLSANFCHAQPTNPQIRIVDVMPTVDPGTVPQTPLISLDFLIGAYPRPTWWGLPWRTLSSTEKDFPSLRDFKGQVTATTAKGTEPLGYAYCCSYATRWNEALGLYTVHVRVSLGNGTKPWPKKAKLNFRGELPAPFEASPQAPTLPFEVDIDELPAKGFPDAQLASPRPSLWVKWVRVFRHPADEKRSFPYEADVMLAGRRAKIRHGVGALPRFVDENGKEVVARQSGGYGVLGGGDSGNMGTFEFAESPLEFSLQRFGWDDAYGKAAANTLLSQRIEYGGREPLQITFPITREGVPLEGDISSKDWKIESPTPPAN